MFSEIVSVLSGIHVQYIVSHDLFVDGIFFVGGHPSECWWQVNLMSFPPMGRKATQSLGGPFFLIKKCLRLKLKFNEDIHRHIDSRYLQHSSPVVTQTDMVAF